MTQFATSILTGAPVIATNITPTKEDLFECCECAMPLRYRQGSEKRCAHFAHPPDTWLIFCSHRTDAPKGYKRPCPEKTIQIIGRLEELEHITKKQARKVLQKTVAYIQGEWNEWKNKYHTQGYEIKKLKEEIAEKDSEIYSLKLDQDTVDKEKDEKIKFLNRQLHEVTTSITWTESKQHLLNKLLQGEYKSAEILKNIS